MVVVMSKKETSPLQISEAQVLSSLLKSQQSILGCVNKVIAE
jgi:hypothetical protein